MPVYDKWLDFYEDVLCQYREEEILDLGCGNGANTLYLHERGYKVVAADFSKEALGNIEKNIFGVQTMYLDLLKDFWIKDNRYSVIIADLCLHYFDDGTTKKIMREIKRILKDNGVFLARVARMDDYNFGAGEGKEVEHHYYFEGDYTKRFFDEEDVNKYFSIIGDLEYRKTSMVRDEDEYRQEKMLYEIKVLKKKLIV